MSLKCIKLAESSKKLLTRGIYSTAPANGVIRDALRKARELANASADGKDEVGKTGKNVADNAKNSPSATANENAKETKIFKGKDKTDKDQNYAEDGAYEQEKEKVDRLRADAEKRLENVQGLIADLMQDASAALRHGK